VRGGILVVAPHPDDETLGAGGTLLAEGRRGTPLHWVMVTSMTADQGFAPDRIEARRAEIDAVAASYGFASVHSLNLPPARLDVLPRADVIGALARVVADCEPETVLLPHGFDAHSDHAVIFECGLAATKAFRSPSVQKVLTMEILSETNFGRPGTFVPRHYVDVSDVFERKLEIMRLYQTELGLHPFPRSLEALTALGTLRGSECGVHRAESFDVVRSFGRLGTRFDP